MFKRELGAPSLFSRLKEKCWSKKAFDVGAKQALRLSLLGAMAGLLVCSIATAINPLSIVACPALLIAPVIGAVAAPLVTNFGVFISNRKDSFIREDDKEVGNYAVATLTTVAALGTVFAVGADKISEYLPKPDSVKPPQDSVWYQATSYGSEKFKELKANFNKRNKLVVEPKNDIEDLSINNTGLGELLKH